MLPKYFSSVILVFVLHLFLVNCYSGSSTLAKPNSKSRQKRLLSLITDPQLNFYFQYNSCYALAVVVVLPLELERGQSVFLSYNFETNYYYAYFDNAQGLTPVPFTYIDEPGVNLGTKNRVVLPPAYRKFSDGVEISSDVTNKTGDVSGDEVANNNENGTLTMQTKPVDRKDAEKASKSTKDKKDKIKSRKLRGLLQNYFMSRRRFFKMMESKMDSSGLKGSDCLLKAICETAADAFGEHNGLIGSVVDILFLPSASKDEKLPKKYYKAEANGKLRNCKVYDKMCPRGLFDFISKVI